MFWFDKRRIGQKPWSEFVDHMDSEEAIVKFKKEKHKPCLVCTLEPAYFCGSCSFRLCNKCRTKRWEKFLSRDVPRYKCMGDVWMHYAETDCPDALKQIDIRDRDL